MKVVLLHFYLFNSSLSNNLSSLLYFPLRHFFCFPLRWEYRKIRYSYIPIFSSGREVIRTIKLCFLLRYIFSERHFNVHFKYFFFSYVRLLSYFSPAHVSFLLNYFKKTLYFQYLYCRCNASSCLSYTFFRWNYLVHVLWYRHTSRQERVILLVFVQGVCKIFAEISRMSSSHHNKESSNKHVFGNECFSVIERLLSTVNIFTT
jgi:hypothetical protein